MHRTPKHQLADHLLGEPLIAWLDARRPATSWLQLSVDLRDATGVIVTPETLRAWHVAAQGQPTEAAS